MEAQVSLTVAFSSSALLGLVKTKKTFEMFYFTCNESKIYESFTF